jgi:hypothetical protein
LNLFQRFVRRFSGGVPLAIYSPFETSTSSDEYEGMDKYYREYRRDSLVRNCINTLAFFSTNKGHETELEPTKPGNMTEEEKTRFVRRYRGVKDRVDLINRRVNLDRACFIAVVKMKIYGKVGFEKVLGDDLTPTQLLPLQSSQLTPHLDENWRLVGFHYKGERDKYVAEKILYFTNNSLDADLEGLSDIEPVKHDIEARRIIISEALKEGVKTAWAGVAVHRVDTSGMGEEEAQTYLTELKRHLKPGKNILVNQKVESRIFDLKPNLAAMIHAAEYLDQSIIGCFKVPRFLLCREKGVNRATAFAEAQLFINGSVADIQRHLRRELEAQWYTPLLRSILKTPEGEEPPVRVKHRWNPVTIADFAEMADAVSKLYDKGQGAITRRRAYDLLGFDPKEIQA